MITLSRGQGGLARRVLRYSMTFIVIAAFGLSLLGLWMVGSDARDEIDDLATASEDSSQWSLAQAEVELLKLQTALYSAALVPSAESLAELRRRFDVFYVRLSILRTAGMLEGVRAVEGVEPALDQAQAYLDAAIPTIDGPDDELIDALPDLTIGAFALSDGLRDVSLSGVKVFSQQSKQQRERVSEVLGDLAVFAVSLLLLLFAALVILIVQLAMGRRATAEIKQAESRLRSVVSTSHDAILIARPDGCIIDFNPAAELIFGYAAEQAIGRDLATLVEPDPARAETRSGMGRFALSAGGGGAGASRTQLQAVDRAGRGFPVEFAMTTATGRDGPLYICFVRDISDRLAAETELVTARDRALAGEKAKSDLLAVMSHEMRTPINGIMGSLEVLQDTELTDHQRKFVGALEASSGMLLRHVNSVLDISKIDAGGVTALSESFEPIGVVCEVLASLEGQAMARGNTLRVDLVTDDIGTVNGDPERLQQLLVNLVGNAIKFTKGGSISVEVERLSGGRMVEFRVVDTGIGIKDVDIDRVFADFVTVDTNYSRDVEGTGLGLGIAKRLVAVMDGTLGVESEPGEGSVFWFKLPLPVAIRNLPPRILTDDEAAPSRVLLVEDNEINRLVATEMLEKLGCEVTVAVDGQAGLDWAGRQVFDLILMDISMPQMDGVAATRLIRQDGPNKGTPIVAMTAHALPEDVEGFADAGMSDVLVKPVTKKRLKHLLKALDTADHAKMRHTEFHAFPDAQLAQEELVSVLGSQKAATLVARAEGELREGITELLDVEMGLDEIANHAHKLAGVAAMIGHHDLRRTLVAVAEVARSDDREGLGPLFTALLDELGTAPLQASA